MGPPMHASAPTVDGKWYAVLVCPDGQINRVVPGLFDTKEASDSNAKWYVGLPG